MNKRSLQILLSLLLLLIVSSAQAARPPFWQHEEVVEKYLEIGLSDQEAVRFRIAVTDYLYEVEAMVDKTLRRNDTGAGKLIKRKSKSLAKNLDADVSKFLTEDQMSRYQGYRKVLIKKMLKAYQWRL